MFDSNLHGPLTACKEWLRQNLHGPLTACKEWFFRQRFPWNRSSFPIFHELEYLLVNIIKNYGKSACYQWVNPLFLWPFSIATLNYQRVVPSASQNRLPIEPPGSHRDHTLNGFPGSGVAGFAFRQLRKHLTLGKFLDLVNIQKTMERSIIIHNYPCLSIINYL